VATARRLLAIILLLAAAGYGGERSWAEQLLGWFDFAPNPRVALLLAHAALWWALALLLHALRVYITAGGIKRVRRTPLPVSPRLRSYSR